MELKVLAIGDVVGNPGMDRVCRSLRQLKMRTGANFVVVNGENASVVGMTPRQAVSHRPWHRPCRCLGAIFDTNESPSGDMNSSDTVRKKYRTIITQAPALSCVCASTANPRYSSPEG